jgi:hypothetical protein
MNYSIRTAFVATSLVFITTFSHLAIANSAPSCSSLFESPSQNHTVNLLRTGSKFISRTLLYSTLASFGLAANSVWQARNYFDEILKFETGLLGEDQERFERILRESGFASEKEAMEWLRDKYNRDPEVKEFMDALEAELNKTAPPSSR